MKIKNLIIIIILALLSGCTNEPLPVEVNMKFTVDNTYLIAPFTYEVSAGEISKVLNGYKIKTYFLVYDTDNKLVQKQNIRVSGYEKVEFPLPEKAGKYTLVIITQWAKTLGVGTAIDGNDTWNMYYDEDLYTLVLSSTLSKCKGLNGILGLRIKEIDTTKELSENQLEAPIIPATALLMYRVSDVHKFGEEGAYSLAINKSEYDVYAQYLDFEYYAEAQDAPSNYICEIMPSDYKSSVKNIYGFFSLLPTGKTSFRFDHCTSSSNKPLTQVLTIEPQSGKEYLMELNLSNTAQNNEITFTSTIVNGTSKAASIDDQSLDDSQYTVSVMELWDTMNNRN